MLINHQEIPKILLVDDSETNLLVLEFILNSLNVELVKCTSGEIALKYFQEQEFALIILDVQMPMMDGLQTAALMREYEQRLTILNQERRQTPIMFITAYQRDDLYINNAYSLTCIDYLIKPINPEVLKAKVTALIDIYNHEKDIKLKSEQLQKVNQTLEHKIKNQQKIEDYLQELEQRFNSIFIHSTIGIALVDLQGNWFKFNQSLCQILGYSIQELEGINSQFITHPEDWKIEIDNQQKLLTGIGEVFQMEKRYIHKQGYILWTLLTTSLVKNAEGEPLYFIMQIQPSFKQS
jgi:PAS domain S-box-containing protein